MTHSETEHSVQRERRRTAHGEKTEVNSIHKGNTPLSAFKPTVAVVSKVGTKMALKNLIQTQKCIK